MVDHYKYSFLDLSFHIKEIPAYLHLFLTITIIKICCESGCPTADERIKNILHVHNTLFFCH